MRRIIWSPEAIDDLIAIREYIAEFDPHAAESVAQKLIALSRSLRDFPRRGRPIDGEVRQLSNVWPYLLRYRVTEDGVQILSVRHGAREA